MAKRVQIKIDADAVSDLLRRLDDERLVRAEEGPESDYARIYREVVKRNG